MISNLNKNGQFNLTIREITSLQTNLSKRELKDLVLRTGDITAIASEQGYNIDTTNLIPRKSVLLIDDVNSVTSHDSEVEESVGYTNLPLPNNDDEYITYWTSIFKMSHPDAIFQIYKYSAKKAKYIVWDGDKVSYVVAKRDKNNAIRWRKGTIVVSQLCGKLRQFVGAFLNFIEKLFYLLQDKKNKQ